MSLLNVLLRQRPFTLPACLLLTMFLILFLLQLQGESQVSVLLFGGRAWLTYFLLMRSLFRLATLVGDGRPSAAALVCSVIASSGARSSCRIAADQPEITGKELVQFTIDIPQAFPHNFIMAPETGVCNKCEELPSVWVAI